MGATYRLFVLNKNQSSSDPRAITEKFLNGSKITLKSPTKQFLTFERMHCKTFEVW